MRWARSYSIIDHQMLHSGYLNRLSHESMVLYLFLVVVGDRQGRSFYSERLVMETLHLSGQQISRAMEELISEGLISYRRPYWQVKNISQGRSHAGARNDNPWGRVYIRGVASTHFTIRGVASTHFTVRGVASTHFTKQIHRAKGSESQRGLKLSTKKLFECLIVLMFKDIKIPPPPDQVLST